MIAQDLHPFRYGPEIPAPSVTPPPRPRPRLPLAALALAAVVGSVGGGAAVSTVLNRSQATPIRQAATTTSAAAATTGASGASTGIVPSAESIYAQDAPAVVTISTQVVSRFGQTGQGTGSGIVLDSSGDIVTNAHVVAGAGQITVTFADGTTAAATLVGADSSADLAVLRVAVSSSRLHPITIGNSDAVQVGDRVYAIGAPFGLSGTLTEGIVSGLHRSNTNAGSGAANLIQTDAAINPGNSGGALLNAQGQLIGITESITSPVNGNVGVGFAIPVNQVDTLVPALEKA